MTTVVSKRWWAPTGERSVDELLTPGTDPKLDLGLALLGLHRAGAEACELVANTPLADEVVLGAALAETRALVAPSALAVVAKSVGGAAYAGLLLRDHLDDAEAAALALYRTCVSKHVPAPLAAHRVGLVYGVPAHALGRYPMLASDPKSTEAALVDLADRVLFGHVAKTVREEAEVYEQVSKTRPGDSEYLRSHNETQDERGRFTRLGRRAREQAEVLPGKTLDDMLREAREREEQAVKPAMARPARPTRRTMRTQRTQRTQQTEATRPTEGTSRLAGRALARRALAGGRLVQRTLSARALRAQQLSDTPAPTIRPVREHVPVLGDMLKRREDTQAGKHYRLGEVAFVLPGADFAAMNRSSGEGEGPRTRRVLAGPLADLAGQPAPYVDNATGEITDEHAENLDRVVEQQRARYPELEDPEHALIVKAFDQEDLLGLDEHAAQRMLTAMKRDLILNYNEEWDAHLNPATEATYVHVLVDYDEPGQMVLVYQPPLPGAAGGELGERPIPSVYELITTENAMGTDHAVGARRSDIDVDPNQAYDYRPTRTSTGGDLGMRVFFDRTRRAIRQQIFLQPRDDEVGKADSDYEREHNVTHGESGRFERARPTAQREAETEVLPGITLEGMLADARAKYGAQVMPEAPVARRTAQTRRTQRTQRTAQAEPPRLASRKLAPRAIAQRVLAGRTLSKRDLALQQRLAQRALAQRVAPAVPEEPGYTPGLLNLFDDFDYTVLDARALARIWQASEQHGFVEDAMDTWTLPREVMNRLHERGGPEPGGYAEERIRSNAIDAYNELLRRDEADFVVFRHALPVDDDEKRVEEIENVAHHLEQFDVLDASVERRGDSDVVTVRALANPLPVQGLFTYPRGVPSADEHVDLSPSNVRRLVSPREITTWLLMLTDRMHEPAVAARGDNAVMVNPRVKVVVAEPHES